MTFPNQHRANHSIIVTINYSSKWIEVKALARTLEFRVIKFLKINIFFGHGLPPSIFFNNNEPQFSRKELKCLREELCIDRLD